MKIEFEFDDAILREGIPMDGVAVISVVDPDGGYERYVTGALGDPSDVKAFGMFAFGYEATKQDLLEGVEGGD